MAKTFANTLGISFRRVQFTPDLLPSDITGTKIFSQEEGTFVLQKGPIFANIVLADEINRSAPKTQAFFFLIFSVSKTDKIIYK